MKSINATNNAISQKTNIFNYWHSIFMKIGKVCDIFFSKVYYESRNLKHLKENTYLINEIIMLLKSLILF